jgi:hypothetical protein
VNVDFSDPHDPTSVAALDMPGDAQVIVQLGLGGYVIRLRLP